MADKYSPNIPYKLEPNRVERLYIGGSLLDEWQGIGDKKDSTMSEEFIASTVEYIGPKKDVIEKGISRTVLDDRSIVNLQDLIQSNRAAFLGKHYVNQCKNGQMGVLARVGDTVVRLVIQVHPTDSAAKKYFNFPSGKTEVWYILNTREVDGVHPYVYAGFKKHVTQQLWRELFDNQDVDGMLSCMHKINVKVGDTILIDSGMPHAMGSGSLFLEVHEPCDYTIRLEKNYSVRSLSDEELHYGAGYDAMFDMFEYQTYTEDEIIEKVLPKPVVEEETDEGILTEIIGYDATEKFCVKRLELSGEFGIPDFNGHYIAITTKGQTTLEYNGGSITVEQGRGVFIPAECKDLFAFGNCEIILAYPFKA